ncbi:MAG TPA: bacillithiol biosynthesis deacetylase BshB1 [Thermoanaerobaculia bacterium]|nr:bacillithiol biosynthesis deacetylase BshB1 [Thermoanaerobaculia bacterium]
MTEVDLLFFGAHADDVELAAGGTIARAVRDGLRAGIVDLTRGEMGTRGTPAVRKREARAAARILGASFREQLDFGDGNLRTGRDEELEIIRIIRRSRPRLLFAPYPEDRHPDHTRTGRLVTDAWFYAGLRQLRTDRPAYRPQAVVYYLQNYLFGPSFVVDTTAAWKTKMRALAAYKSQFHDPKSKEPRTFISDPRFLEMIEARGRHFGALIGTAYGEAFVTRQPPRVDDLIAAYGGREV